MKKKALLLFVLVLSIQMNAAHSRTNGLSFKDFEPRRPAFCEIFTEPN